MSAPAWKKKWRSGSVFRGLSIQQRLPLLICILLLCIVIAFGLTSYLGMRNTSIKLGGERLSTLTQQLSLMFQQTSEGVISNTRTTALDEGVMTYLQSPGRDSEKKALKALQKLREDTLSVLVEILDSSGKRLLKSGKDEMSLNADLGAVLQEASKSRVQGIVGKIYMADSLMYFPIIAAVMHDKELLGFIVRWRWLYATPKGIEQFSQLIGSNAGMYIGNNDMKFWTDMIKSVEAPPIDSSEALKGYVQYAKTDNNEVVASLRPVPNTNWLILVEFSRHKVLEVANTFLLWVVGVGVLLTALGIFFSWLVSRNITRPLNELTVAASSMANGNYNFKLGLDRTDELGKLARAFHAMSVQVRAAQYNLEKKVQDRTAKLEMVNKELEAFSYSVSHDLRAPLRAVSGYAVILKEDYDAKLDAEGKRVINAIISSARLMGVLIDDLIAFSRIGRKELSHDPVNMKTIVDGSVSELLDQNAKTRYKVHVDPLPSSYGDQSMIKQVWMNLIGNAIKYSSREATPCIEIGFKEETDRNIYFIRDNGVGFDMQYAHKLFGVFQRLHSAEDFEGTGIGLALVQRVINKHGGEVWASSEPGHGATFFFSLPKNTNA